MHAQESWAGWSINWYLILNKKQLIDVYLHIRWSLSSWNKIQPIELKQDIILNSTPDHHGVVVSQEIYNNFRSTITLNSTHIYL